MTFRDQGFLSNASSDWTNKVHHDFKNWFGLVDRLNRCAMQVLHEGEPSQSSNKELLMAALYGRILQSFQGAVLLAERGMLTDARSLVRSCVESTIALGGASKLPDFADRLIEDHHKHRQTIANSILADNDYASLLTQNEISKLNQLLSDIKNQYQDHKLKGVNWEDTARKSGLSVLYMTIYRDFSGSSAHATIDSLNWHIQSDSNGNIEALHFGPKDSEMVETLSGAVNCLLFAGMILIDDFKLSHIENELRCCISQWKTLTESVSLRDG